MVLGGSDRTTKETGRRALEDWRKREMTPPPLPPHPAGSQSSSSDPILACPPSNCPSPTPQRQQQPPPPQQPNRQHAHPPSREARHQQNIDLQAPPRSGGGGGVGQQRFGQYVIIKTLGEGSFGKVKLAVHQVTGQKVALKIISRRKLINKDMAGRVEREIQYLQLLRHPHIIKL